MLIFPALGLAGVLFDKGLNVKGVVRTGEAAVTGQEELILEFSCEVEVLIFWDEI